MILKNEDELDNFIICHKCHTLHEKISLNDGSKAYCFECNEVIYSYDSRLVDHALAFSITGLIFFILANVFPLIQIDLLGNQQFITIPKTIFSLFDSGFFIVGFICMFLIFIFPLMVFLINILLFTLLKLKKGKNITKELLVLLSHIKPWNMSDIFFISLLVALVKLISFGQIHIGVSFWTLIIFVIIDMYITKSIHLSEIWMLRDKVWEKRLNNDKS